jgi:hypothetical protein
MQEISPLGVSEIPVAASAHGLAVRIHEGMPPLAPGPLYPSFKRLLSDPVFYIVPACMWVALSLRYLSATLPSAANPAMEVGGLWGESKTQGHELFGSTARCGIAPYLELDRSGNDPHAERDMQRVREGLASAGLDYPLIAKPDRGYQGWGVKLAQDEADVRSYLTSLQPGEGLILQEYITYGGEAGLFYVRHPGEPRGRITSLALTYAPHIVGDGRATLKQLVMNDTVLAKSAAIYRPQHGDAWDLPVAEGEVVILTHARSARLGAVYRDARDLVTPALEERVEEIARDIEGFHFGRFDIRFRSVEALQRGEDFYIVELNGAGAEMLHLWDGRAGIVAAYRTLWMQYRTLFALSAENQRRGHKPVGFWHMLKMQMRQEKLRRSYPPST